MKTMNCPLNGPRNIEEFAWGGEVIVPPDANAAPDEEWADYLFAQANEAGVVREWWLHVPSGYWFVAERNTITDEIISTYSPDVIFGPRPNRAHCEPAREDP